MTSAPTADLVETNTRIVLDFLESWQAIDPQAVLAHMTDDLVYEDVPFEALQDAAHFEQRLNWFMSFFTECELVVRNLAVTAEGHVLTERRDRFKVKDKWLELRVASVGVIRDGKVAEWREYYDAESAEREMASCLGESFRIDLRDEVEANR